jgi:hypothetical protein
MAAMVRRDHKAMHESALHCAAVAQSLLGPAPEDKVAADPYRDVPLGVECAWPAAAFVSESASTQWTESQSGRPLQP